MADDDDVVCPLPALRKVRRRRQYTTGRRARTNGYEALDHDSRIIGRRTPAATRATHHAALRSRVTIRRPASRAARTSSSTTWPARIASSRRARVWHQRQAAFPHAPRRGRQRGRHTTARAYTPSPRPHNKKNRRRLRALLLRLAQVHRQVRDAAHHAEAQVEFFKYY